MQIARLALFVVNAKMGCAGSVIDLGLDNAELHDHAWMVTRHESGRGARGAASVGTFQRDSFDLGNLGFNIFCNARKALSNCWRDRMVSFLVSPIKKTYIRNKLTLNTRQKGAFVNRTRFL
jgi:hypothetical protein